jgi:hypothetical protein
MLAEMGASAVVLLDDLISSLVVLIAVASIMLWLGLRSRRHGK